MSDQAETLVDKNENNNVNTELIIAQKGKLIETIKTYCKNKRFHEFLKNEGIEFNYEKFNNMSVENLQLTLTNIQYAIKSKNQQSLFDITLLTTLKALESTIAKATSLQIKGTVEKTFADEHFLDVLEQLKIKRGIGNIKIPPELEIGYILLSNAFITHKLQSIQQVPQTMKRPKQPKQSDLSVLDEPYIEK